MNGRVKIFVSMPMDRIKGKDDWEDAIRELEEKVFRGRYGKRFEVIDSYFSETRRDLKREPLMYLGKSIEAMANADCVYFCGDWKYTRGCVIEHEIARRYGINIIGD